MVSTSLTKITAGTVQRWLLLAAVASGILLPYRVTTYLPNMKLRNFDFSMPGILIAVSLIIFLVFEKDRFDYRIILPFFLFGIAIVLSVIFSEYQINFSVIRSIVLCVAGAYLFAFYFQTKNDYKYAVAFIGACLAIQALLTVVQAFTLENFLINYLVGDYHKKFGTEPQLAFGLTYSAVRHGCFMMMFLGVAIFLLLKNKENKGLVFGLSCIIFLSGILSGSRAVWIGMVTVVLVLAVFGEWRKSLVLLGCFSLVFFLLGQLTLTAVRASRESRSEGLSEFDSGGAFFRGVETRYGSLIEMLKGHDVDIVNRDHGVSFRLKVFSLAWQAFKENAVFGVGFKQFPAWSRKRILTEDTKNKGTTNSDIDKFKKNVEALALLVVKGPIGAGYPYNSWTLERLSRAILDETNDPEFSRAIPSIIVSPSFKRVFQAVQLESEGYDTHNMYLSILAEMGIIGTLSFIFMMFIILMYVYKSYSMAPDLQKNSIVSMTVVLSGILTIGMFWHILLWKELWIVMGGLIGLTQTIWQEV